MVEGNNVYLLSKGRTNNKGFAPNNQNYALRLRGQGGEGCVSFLFFSQPEKDMPGEWHRWTSNSGVVPDNGWFHVAVTYEFGSPESVRGYLNGKPVSGKWDMGGPTKRPPVADDDELWIGSALGGSRNNSFEGGMDEVAIHREILPVETLAQRYARKAPPPPPPFTRNPWPSDKVLVELIENFRTTKGWPREDSKVSDVYEQDLMGFFRVPHKYGSHAGRVDRSGGFLLRALTTLTLPPGTHELLLRSRWEARLWINGERILHLPRPSKKGGAHGNVPKIPQDWPSYLRIPGPGDEEIRVKLVSKGEPLQLRFETLVGEKSGKKKLRHDLGETLVAVSSKDELFALAGPGRLVPLTDRDWMAWRRKQEPFFRDLDSERRRKAAEITSEHWEKRRAHARQVIAAKQVVEPPAIPNFLPVNNSVDNFIGAGLLQAAKNLRATPDSTSSRLFRDHVRPLLKEKCFKCHHGEKAKGGLRLDSLAAALKGGDSDESALVPGKPGESMLFVLASSRDDDERMPPKGDPVNAGELKTLRKWIEAGAPWPNEKASRRTEGNDIPVTQADLATADLLPTPLTSDLEFLRRVTLDVVGVFPSEAEILSFEADDSPDKRSNVIDRLLDDPRRADNWVGYWQDALAENPNVLKPKLNNTGPFREWIYESLLDNKPMDRFATELILMEGSALGGGPAGFGMATQNDVPMAAKAHVLSSAFLGTNLQCARCHDAPYHPFKQADLFGMAAMLARKPVQVPASSSVVLPTEGTRLPLVEVTLKPGSSVKPEWTFDHFAKKPSANFLQKTSDSRESLAALITSPENERFAEVLVNRLWKRLFGHGIIASADDWHNLRPSHPELLTYLGREFVRGGYDLKKLERLLLNSHAYQRQTRPDTAPRNKSVTPLFAAAIRRRLTAEQVVDGLYHATGLPMEVGELNMDRDGGLGPATFLNLGYPRKAWQYASLSNERDRPSLAFPRLQAVIDVLAQFGWRTSRQDPLTKRETSPHALQPGILSNGILSTWLTRLSDEHGITNECLKDRSLDELINVIFLRFLTRRPTETERASLHTLLAEGYETRVIPQADRKPTPYPKKIPAVSWSNHLSPEANAIVLELEKRARDGAPPVNSLAPAWRERLEDALWALINSPELLFLP